ncbi:MAG: hypothetical protein IJ588_02420 [Prevotella sp.]|nr:hypothetical protein [Prevotella sp.]
MIRNKVKEIVEHLTSTYESDTVNIHFGMSHTTLYLPYGAIYDCDDDTVMHVEDGDRELWISYDKIEYIEG